MQTNVEDLGGSRKKLAFDVPPDEVEEELNKYCKQLAKEVNVRGFRKGKAPPSVIKRYFKQQIIGEVATQIVSSALEKAMKDHSLTPLGEPDVDMPPLVEGENFAFSVTLDVKPEVELNEYKDLAPEQEEPEVTEEELEKSLEELQKAHAEVKGIEEDRETVNGDVVMVDYEGLFEGEPLPGNEKKDVYIELGSGGHKKEVEEALVGVRVGDSRDVDVEYPANFVNKELAGQTIPHRFHVRKIMKKELPALDDEFAKDVGEFENLDALKERLRQQILHEKKMRARKRIEEEVLDAVMEKNPVEAPASLVQARLQQLMIDAQSHFLSQGLTLENDSEDGQHLKSELESIAEKDVKKQLLLDAIAEKESLAVSDEEAETEIRRYALQTGQSMEKVRAEIQKDEQGLEHFRQNLLRQKTLDFLLPSVRIEEEEKKEEESQEK